MALQDNNYQFQLYFHKDHKQLLINHLLLDCINKYKMMKQQ